MSREGAAGAVKKLWHFCKAVVRNFIDDDAMSLAAAVAFYTSFSFAPLVLLILAAGGMIDRVIDLDLLRFFEGQLGPGAGEVTGAVVDAPQKDARLEGSWRWYLGLAVLLFSASAVFAQLQTALNRIWGVQAAPVHPDTTSDREQGVVNGSAPGAAAPRMAPTADKGWRTHARTVISTVWRWLRKRLLSMGMVLAILFILLVALVVTTVIDQLVPEDLETAGTISALAISFVVTTALFAAIFKVLPDVEISWKDVWFGAAITSLLFTIGQRVVSFYLDNLADSYSGAAGAMIALLAWVYIASLILFLGAEVTQQWALLRGARLRPEPHARRVKPEKAAAV